MSLRHGLPWQTIQESVLMHLQGRPGFIQPATAVNLGICLMTGAAMTCCLNGCTV